MIDIFNGSINAFIIFDYFCNLFLQILSKYKTSPKIFGDLFALFFFTTEETELNYYLLKLNLRLVS